VTKTTRAGARSITTVLALAFLLSGIAGLIHEVVWTRLLSHVFGVTSFAVSTVLAAYMGGLALGSALVAARGAHVRNGARLYALLEIGIGLYALAVPTLLDLIEPIYGAVWRRFHLSFGPFTVLRFLLASAMLVVPTMMMGATLPLLAHDLARRRPQIRATWLYSLNLLGAVLGAAAAGFMLMPSVGVWGTIFAGAMINIAVGVVVYLLPPAGEPAKSDAPVEAVAPSPLLLSVAFVSGLLALATQVAWTRVLCLIVGSTTYALSAVLVSYLIALAAGSAYAARRAARERSITTDLMVMHLLSGAALVASIYAVNQLPFWYLDLYRWWAPEAQAGVVGRSITIALGVLFVPVFFAGTVLPLSMAASLPRQSRGTATAVGRIVAVNTVGAICGALLSGFIFVPLLGTQRTLLIVALTTGAMALVIALFRSRNQSAPSVSPPPRGGDVRGGIAFAGALLIVIAAWFRPEWNHSRLHAGVFEPSRDIGEILDSGERVLYQREGRSASVVVLDWVDHPKFLFIDARVNASDHPGDMATQTLLAQIPLLLAPRTADVFVLGWGSGVTVGSALQGDVERITAVELEPAVVEASQLFTHINHDPLSDPRVRLFEDDARHILLAADDTYDVIISEPSHPWVSGVANLFTQDFYQLAAQRLRADGVMAQWVQSYQISFDTYRTLLATFQSVFPEVAVFFTPGTTDTILIGSRQPLRLAQLGAKWSRPATQRELARIELHRPEHLLAGLVLHGEKLRSLTRDVPLNTDDNVRVEFGAIAGMIAKNLQVWTELERIGVAPETALPDPYALLGDRDRLTALIKGLELMERRTKAYEGVLNGLP
jgi:spermidine synthase